MIAVARTFGGGEFAADAIGEGIRHAEQVACCVELRVGPEDVLIETEIRHAQCRTGAAQLFGVLRAVECRVERLDLRAVDEADRGVMCVIDGDADALCVVAGF